MNAKLLMLSMFAMSGLLTGCLKEPEMEPVLEDGIEINLEGSISQEATKVNAQGFENGDALALYAVNYLNNNQIPGQLLAEGNQADHVKYIYKSDGRQWTPVKKVYFKDVNTNVDLYAFYPHSEPDNVDAWNFEVKKDQSTARTSSSLGGYEASDLLWGKVENVAPTEQKIRIQLEHKMAGAEVILKQGTGFEADDFHLLEKSVITTGTTRKANVNLSTGEVTPVGTAQTAGIVMCVQTDGSFRSVVVPQTVAAGTPLFNITIAGISYKFSKQEDFTYTPGKISKFTIKISRKNHTGEYEIELVDTQIVPWTEDRNIHEGEARQYYCVNCTEPGTLGELIKADNKNPKKIRNLKVSGKITTEDFYFMRDEMTILEAVNLKESKVVNVKVSEYPVYGHDDDHGNRTVFYKREAGVVDDVIPDEAFYNKKSLYYFTFPEKVTEIGCNAFSCSSISGALVIPDDVKYIFENGFSATNIGSVQFPDNLEIIDQNTFSSCSSLSGTLSLPQTLRYIGSETFSSCSLTGNLFLPQSLEYIGSEAFESTDYFVGGLSIPEKITKIGYASFSTNLQFDGVKFNGVLKLNNVTTIKNEAFMRCQFTGELIIPEGVTEIGSNAFYNNNFSSVKFPSTLKIIKSGAFWGNLRISDGLVLPEGMVSIGSFAFEKCSNIRSLEFPSTLQTIQSGAFKNCSGVNKIICHSTEPPTVISSAFDGVPKDNFTVEVPANAVKRYQADPVWGQFKRIAAHYDFSVSRSRARALNAQTTKTYTLRAPAGYNWSVESKPEWITVTPASGTAKTEITVTFSNMAGGEATPFKTDVTNANSNYPATVEGTFNGRSGEIVFLLDEKNYRTTMEVEQFDSQYSDGELITINKATKGNGVNIVLLGDCYDAADIAAGNYVDDIKKAADYFFAVEPYSTYKDYFNVYCVVGVSDDSGMGTLNTIKDSKFGSSFGGTKIVEPNVTTCFDYANKAPIGGNIAQALVILVENSSEYGGVTFMYGDGSAIACCPKSADAYPYDFRGIVQHEAGGHGFGKLADEYIYHNAFISTCGCVDGCGHADDLNAGKARGWYRNLELTGDMKKVGWSHFIFNPKYSDNVDIFEGGYFHSRGVYRSEANSCMNNNIPYFSAISRQAIVERIMQYAGEEFTLDKFYAKDSDAFGSITKASRSVASPLTTVFYNKLQSAPVYMGDKPNYKPSK